MTSRRAAGDRKPAAKADACSERASCYRYPTAVTRTFVPAGEGPGSCTLRQDPRATSAVGNVGSTVCPEGTNAWASGFWTSVPPTAVQLAAAGFTVRSVTVAPAAAVPLFDRTRLVTLNVFVLVVGPNTG